MHITLVIILLIDYVGQCWATFFFCKPFRGKFYGSQTVHKTMKVLEYRFQPALIDSSRLLAFSLEFSDRRCRFSWSFANQLTVVNLISFVVVYVFITHIWLTAHGHWPFLPSSMNFCRSADCFELFFVVMFIKVETFIRIT